MMAAIEAISYDVFHVVELPWYVVLVVMGVGACLVAGAVTGLVLFLNRKQPRR